MTSCVFGRLSDQSCGPKRSLNHPLQTLDELDAGDMENNSSKKRLSWLILSRVGINYLFDSNNSYYGKWVICFNHRKQFLDSWQINTQCCHHNHVITDHHSKEVLRHRITLESAVRVLKIEGSVLPIGGLLCDLCHFKMLQNPGEKSSLVVEKDKLANPVVTSPFCQEPLSESINPNQSAISSSQQQISISYRDISKDPLITVKTEVLEDLVVTDENQEHVSDDHANMEDLSDEFMFSEDSDDDRTWMPEKSKPKKISSCSPGRKRRNFKPKTSNVQKQKRSSDQISRGSDNIEEKESASADSSEDTENESDHPVKKKKCNATPRFFCKLCQISFFKQSSYKQHMRSSKRVHKEIIHKDTEEETILNCKDCDTVFNEREKLSLHMKEVHNNRDGAYFCEECQVHLKSESAFKSHKSKLHIERTSKLFYCRECDHTFECRLKHEEHIKSHRLFNDKDPCIQCKICGKVFTSKQELAYQKHMVTHDSELEQDCMCKLCKKEEESAEKNLVKIVPVEEIIGKDSSLFQEMQKKFDLESEKKLESNEKKDPLNFPSDEEKGKREESRKKKHHTKGSQVNKRVFTVKKTKEKKKKKLKSKENSEKQQRNWQECPDRNWAAEFGYGKRSALDKIQSGDLLSKMKLMFKPSEDFEEEKEGDEGEQGQGNENEMIFRTRGFKGTVKASPQKMPRTLSDSSLSTRKRMEALIKRAREHQANKKKEKQKNENKKTVDGQEDDETAEEEEEDAFDGFEDEDDSLLIPLANGWVCEKKCCNGVIKYKTAFWSPDGEEFKSIKEIENHAKSAKITLDISVFQKALTKNPNKIVEKSSL